jgi:hypothetical protein
LCLLRSSTDTMAPIASAVNICLPGRINGNKSDAPVTVALSIIIMGQNIQGRAADKRAEQTFEDAAATLQDAEEIQKHLILQDQAINDMLDKLVKLEASMGKA